jgi:hypothetical protein
MKEVQNYLNEGGKLQLYDGLWQDAEQHINTIKEYIQKL